MIVLFLFYNNLSDLKADFLQIGISMGFINVSNGNTNLKIVRQINIRQKNIKLDCQSD